MKKRADAKKAIRRIAMRERVTVEEVHKQMKLAILAGLCNQDSAVQARWKKIPCEGEVPTPGELIAYLATHIDAGLDLFAGGFPSPEIRCLYRAAKIKIALDPNANWVQRYAINRHTKAFGL